MRITILLAVVFSTIVYGLPAEDSPRLSALQKRIGDCPETVQSLSLYNQKEKGKMKYLRKDIHGCVYKWTHPRGYSVIVKTPLQKTLGDSGALNAKNLGVYFEEGLISSNTGRGLSFRHADRDWVLFNYDPDAVPYNELLMFQQFNGVLEWPRSIHGKPNANCAQEVSRLNKAGKYVIDEYGLQHKFRYWTLNDFVFKKDQITGEITAIAINVQDIQEKGQNFIKNFAYLSWGTAIEGLEENCSIY